MSGDFLTRREIKELCEERFTQRLNEYEILKVEPRHAETTAQLNRLMARMNSLYRNGSGGPPGAVELLQATVKEMLDEQRRNRRWLIGILCSALGAILLEILRLVLK